MASENNDGIGSFLGKALLLTAGVGLGAYVIHEVAKEYDDTVDKYNELIDFVNNHDFYEKKQEPEKKPELVKIDTVQSLKKEDVDVWQDPFSGFKLYKPVS